MAPRRRRVQTCWPSGQQVPFTTWVGAQHWLPPRQTWPAGQHPPPQGVWLPGQGAAVVLQVPLTQLWPAGQAPHSMVPPQPLGVGPQAPGGQADRGTQGDVQVPFTQLWPAGQALAQAPQWAGLVERSTQTPPQTVCPPEQGVWPPPPRGKQRPPRHAAVVRSQQVAASPVPQTSPGGQQVPLGRQLWPCGQKQLKLPPQLSENEPQRPGGQVVSGVQQTSPVQT
jgi:hypothetical protein